MGIKGLAVVFAVVLVGMPVQGQADREATAAKIAACLTGADTVLATGGDVIGVIPEQLRRAWAAHYFDAIDVL